MGLNAPVQEIGNYRDWISLISQIFLPSFIKTQPWPLVYFHPWPFLHSGSITVQMLIASEFCGSWDSDFATGLWDWGRRGPHRAPSWLTSVVTTQRVWTMSARCSVLSIHSSRILDHGGGLCETNHKNNSCLKESQNSDRHAKSNSGTRSIRCQVPLFLNGPLISIHYTSYTVRRLLFRSACAV